MGKMIAIFFCQDLIFDDHWKNCKNHRTRKNFVPHGIRFNERAKENWWTSRNLNDCSDGGIYMETMILRIELKSLLSEFNVLCSCR